MFTIFFPSFWTEHDVRHFLCQNYDLTWFSALDRMGRGDENSNFAWYARLKVRAC